MTHEFGSLINTVDSPVSGFLLNKEKEKEKDLIHRDV